jgi:hypothetical protein
MVKKISLLILGFNNQKEYVNKIPEFGYKSLIQQICPLKELSFPYTLSFSFPFD